MSWRTTRTDRGFPDLLNGSELYSVVIIFDYIQLLFNRDGTMITVHSKCSVQSDGQFALQGEKGFADLLTSLIGQLMDRLDDTTDERLTLRFRNNATVSISLLDQDQTGPEAAEIHIPGQPAIVIQP